MNLNLFKSHRPEMRDHWTYTLEMIKLIDVCGAGRKFNGKLKDYYFIKGQTVHLRLVSSLSLTP